MIGTVACNAIPPVAKAAVKPITAEAIPLNTKMVPVKATVIVPNWAMNRTTLLSIKPRRPIVKSPIN